MTARHWCQLASIPVCIAGACLAYVLFPLLAVPFALMALALTAALIWGRE